MGHHLLSMQGHSPAPPSEGIPVAGGPDSFCRTGFATPSGIFSGSPPVNVSDGVANPVLQRIPGGHNLMPMQGRSPAPPSEGIPVAGGPDSPRDRGGVRHINVNQKNFHALAEQTGRTGKKHGFFRQGTLRPGKKPGFFAVQRTARKLFDLLNVGEFSYCGNL
ncbi:Uncharacterized protein dnm_012080 [Desulfonema magnum]|uniref:Uncharacterized protein n=1 Tax=Desulfonema magnum TaxID=45655 RepID=A0A975BH47_9BACT|nr:Uncharacterized protein dnm_012080 [Desulfonema magnum]